MFMGSGDVIRVDIHDTPDGLSIQLDDLTSGAHGSMVAGAKNHWTHVLYEPGSAKCHVEPYSFHPMYSTSSELTTTPWAASTDNVEFSDEIGHFEYCDAIDEDGNCTGSNANDPGGLDEDDYYCFDALDSLLAKVGGCLGEDDDHDGTSYLNVWPGTNADPKQHAKLHAQPIQFTSPTFNGGRNYDRVAFNTDMPRIEDPDSGGICNRLTGANCVNPLPGAQFYPIYTIGAPVGVDGHGPGHDRKHDALGDCVWRFGGPFLPDTTNTFGGNSVTEYGPILKTLYPGVGNTPVYKFNNFHQTLNNNPCPS
jgi:hypothetical protein